MQQMRRAVRRLPAAFALFLAALGVLGVLLPHPAAAETIQLKKHPGGGYLIAGRINGAVPVTFVLDTGASDVSIPENVARDLERAGKPSEPLGTGTYVLADGSKVRKRRVLLRELTVGGETVSNVMASISQSGSPPLLGQTFLSKFSSWTLDNERALLVLKTKGDDSATSTTAESGDRPGGSGSTYGAFAHDGTSGRYGASWNQGSQARADEAALKGCSSEYCKIVFRMTARQCGALAMTENGKIWGGATRPERDAAERAAVENCEKRTGTSCRLRSIQCNR
jgi:clan AA aspartic protease (TIGR02281 family)